MTHLHTLLHSPHWRPHWRGLLLACALLSAWFAFVPQAPVAMVLAGDKFNHVLAFAAMGLTAAMSLPRGRRAAATAFCGLLLYGAFIEAVQAWLPPRTADVADLMADAGGAIVGLLLAAALRRWVRAAAVP